MQHDLFLCHTGADKDWTRDLGQLLEERRIGNRPIKVFFDEWDIDYGFNIISKIDEGLRESRFLGLVLSPAMVSAPWPTAEWQSQVMDDPSGKSGRLLPLLLHKYDEHGGPIQLPFVLKTLKRFDFTDERKFEVELEKLVRRLANLSPQRGAQRPGRGGIGSKIVPVREPGQEAPDLTEEALTSNLLPVLHAPPLISDATTISAKREVWDNVKGTTPPFFLHGGRLYSFASLADPKNPFKQFLAGTDPKEEPASDWLSDQDGARQVIGLLNSALRQHCYNLNIWTAKRDRSLFYPPILDEKRPREFTWGLGKARTLAVMKKSVKKDGGAFGVHMAARMRFLLLGQRLFLLIDPAWMFTSDGVKPLEGKEMGVFSTKWGGREKNAPILRNVLMWGLLIAEGQREIALNVGTQSQHNMVRVQSVPTHTPINVGVFGDSIRLDRILSGEGAGERKDVEVLNDVANLALVGEPTDDEENELAAHDETGDEDTNGEEDLRLGL